MDANITSPDLVIIDADTEDTDSGSEVAKTLAVGAITTMVVAGTVIAYHRVIKPRVIAFRNRMTEEAGEVIDAVVIETPETEKV
jgi:hypothetical protein